MFNANKKRFEAFDESLIDANKAWLKAFYHNK